MATAISREFLTERRLTKMRLGQQVCAYFELLSDPEVRVALVPLLESEYINCMMLGAQLTVPDGDIGVQLRERMQIAEVLAYSIRSPDTLEKVFKTGKEVGETLEVQDINFLIDAYFEMVDRTSPSVDGLGDEELDKLKKALQEMDWKDLSGRQWYAVKRLLLALSPEPLTDNLLGSISTNSSTMTNELQRSTPTA